MPCDIHRVTVKGESYLVLVGLLNNKPYEIFCGLQEYVEIPKKIKKGFLIKNNKVNEFSPYNLIIPLEDDKLIFKDIIKLFDNPIYGAFTRTLSLSLRHGIPVQYIVEQLRKDKHSDITSFSTVIARVLVKIIFLMVLRQIVQKKNVLNVKVQIFLINKVVLHV